LTRSPPKTTSEPSERADLGAILATRGKTPQGKSRVATAEKSVVGARAAARYGKQVARIHAMITPCLCCAIGRGQADDDLVAFRSDSVDVR